VRKSLAEQLAEKLKIPTTPINKFIKKIEDKVYARTPVTDDNIVVGSIVYLPMSNKDNGFYVKDGKEKSPKMNVIVGFKDDFWAVATLLINTNADEETDDLSDCQLPLYVKDYKGILKHNSTLNCARIFEIPKNRLKEEGDYKGKLIDKDLSSAILCLEETIVIETKEKNKYRIKDKSKQ